MKKESLNLRIIKTSPQNVTKTIPSLAKTSLRITNTVIQSKLLIAAHPA